MFFIYTNTSTFTLFSPSTSTSTQANYALAKVTKESLAESTRKEKIYKNLERKDSIQEKVGIIAFVEAMSTKERKKKVARDATLKSLR